VGPPTKKPKQKKDNTDRNMNSMQWFQKGFGPLQGPHKDGTQGQ